MEKIKYAIACVVQNEKGDILLLKRSLDKKIAPGKWFVIGAYPLEKDADFLKITEREILDEIGLVGKIVKHGQIVKDINDLEVFIYTFLAKVNSGKVVLNNEHSEYKWVRFGDLENFDLAPKTAEIVFDLLKDE